MKLTISKDVLIKGINDVLKAISSKTALPILTGIKIEANNNGVVLTGTDIDLTIQATLPLEEKESIIATVEQPGAVVLPARLFSEIVKKLPDVDVSISADEKHFATLTSGKAEFNLIGWDASDYPMLPKLENEETIQISQKVFKDVINSTNFATATTESRPVLTGVYFQVNEGLVATATDSHRLSNKKTAVETAITELNVVVPAKSLNEISKLLSDTEELVSIVFTTQQACFTFENKVVYSRLLEGNYPDISRLIPTEAKSTVQVNKRDMLGSIERASLLSREDRNHTIKMDINTDGEVIISSHSPELGQVKEEIPTLSFTGEELEIAFSAKYMMDALKALNGDEVTFFFNGGMRPFIIKSIDESEKALQLILPVRVK